jgi:protein-tyrosine phosphatase
MVKILFVCTGNICRSPTAEGVLRTRAAARGLEAQVEAASAGTHGYHLGEPPDPRAVAAALKRGVDLRSQRARRIRREDFGRYDFLIAMDRTHRDALRKLAPAGGETKLGLFMDYAPEFGLKDVPDPYYGDAQDFERVLDMIESGSGRLLDEIERRLAQPGSSG